MEKVCRICNITKPLSEFYKHHITKDGYKHFCKLCDKLKAKNYYEGHKDLIVKRALEYQAKNKEERSSYKKEWYKKNKERISQLRKDHYRENSKSKIEYQANWYKQSDKESLKAKQRKRNFHRRRTDLNFKIKEQLRCRMNRAIKNRAKGGSAVKDLGCSIGYFKQYIANQFQPGMTWENWSYETWHIDHKIPLASFDLTDREQFLKACHYTNLQPMWGRYNISKGAKIDLNL